MKPSDRPNLAQSERVAQNLREAYRTGAQGAMEVVWNHFGHRRTRDWETVFGWLRERQSPGLYANGQMTDALLERLSRFDHITALDLTDSAQVTDAGLRSLKKYFASYNQIIDRSMETLSHMPSL